jgi:transcription antitermination factor NusG
VDGKELSMSWHVINITSGFEQKIKYTIETMMELKPYNKRVFVPIVSCKKFHKDKLYFFSEKLFPGYIFIECKDENYEDIFSYIASIKGVLNMSSIKNTIKTSSLIYDEEILDVVKNIINGPQSSVSFLETQDIVNKKVKIIEGPFANFEGIVLEKSKTSHKETKVKVCTKMFNNDLSIVIVPISFIELIGE